MVDIVKLSSLQKDALKEAANIGAGNAASALSTLASTKVEMSIPDATLVPIDNIPEIVGSLDGEHLLIRINVVGDAPGTIIISMPMLSALALSDILMERERGQTKELGPMGLSAIQEAGNIMTGNYLRALETFLNMSFRSSVPFVAIDKEGDVLNGTLSEINNGTGYAVVIETDLSDRKNKITTQFFLLPNPNSLEKMLEVLGID